MAAIATGDGGPGAGSGFPASSTPSAPSTSRCWPRSTAWAWASGCTLLAHVDLVLMDETARLRAPFAELGVPPEAASSCLLPERMGWQRAAWPSCWPRSGSTPTRQWRPGWPSGCARRDGAGRDAWPWPAGSPRSHPHATREIKRLMMAATGDADRRRPGPRGGGLRRAVRRPGRNPGPQLTAGLEG